MDKQHGDAHYWTTFFEDRKDGFAGFRLHRKYPSGITIAAEVIFWDATGGFTVETFSGVVPIEIIEAVIAEAREKIKTK